MLNMSFDYSVNKDYIPFLRDLADETVAGEARHLVANPINDWGQTPLSLAIALRKVDDLVQQMLDCLSSDDMPALLDCYDLGGWNALDHAAIRTDTNFYARLKELIKIKSYKETIALSSSFLRKIAGCARQAWGSESFYFNMVDEAGTVHKLNGQELLHRFPFVGDHKPTHFSYFPCAKPEVLFEMWNHIAVKSIQGNGYAITSEEDLAGYFDFVERVYHAKYIPEIALQEITHDDLNRPVNVGGGVVALQAIPAGKIIMEYGGEYLQEDQCHSGSHYVFDLLGESFGLEGLYHRTPACMLNHSFPNIKVIRITLPGRVTLAMKTLYPIMPGEQLRISYGIDNYSLSPKQVELAPKALREFLQKHPPIHLTYANSVEDMNLYDQQVCKGWAYLLRDAAVLFLRNLLKARISVVQGAYLFEKMSTVLNDTDVTPLERSRWKILVEPFFKQVPALVFIQAINLLADSPEKARTKAKQLKGKHFLPTDFRFQ